METYTKDQLIKAMTQYNQEVIDNPENFERKEIPAEEKANEQIEYLLSLVK